MRLSNWPEKAVYKNLLNLWKENVYTSHHLHKIFEG
jgi:hypothetical protein